MYWNISTEAKSDFNNEGLIETWDVLKCQLPC